VIGYLPKLGVLCVVLSGAPRGGTVTDAIGAESSNVQLDDGTTVRIVKAVSVVVSPECDLHGPCVVRAANGDLLLCHQDSNQHGGGNGYVHQWRSSDNGVTWKDEGAAADWRKRGLDSLFGEYGNTPDGKLVMFVQRRKVLGGDRGIVGSWWSISDDHGKTWQEQGPVDDSHEYAVMYLRNVVTRDDVMYVAGWGRQGNALYVSTDNGKTWRRRSVVFPTDYPGFETLKNAGPPFYPHVVFCCDGTMLAMTYYTTGKHFCYTRRSADNGRTWGAIRAETDLKLWAPKMEVLDRETLIATGRDIGERAAVAWFSTDNGHTWGHKLILDKPTYPGSYAYTDSISAGDGKFWVFTSSPQSRGKGDIAGILLEVRKRVPQENP